jgi:hypothetical protein
MQRYFWVGTHANNQLMRTGRLVHKSHICRRIVVLNPRLKPGVTVPEHVFYKESFDILHDFVGEISLSN